jgi:hypothetical protein
MSSTAMYMYYIEQVECRILRIVERIHCNQSIQRFKDVLDVQGKEGGICKTSGTRCVCICELIRRYGTSSSAQPTWDSSLFPTSRTTTEHMKRHLGRAVVHSLYLLNTLVTRRQ